MEIFGAFVDEEWESLIKMFTNGGDMNPNFLVENHESSFFPTSELNFFHSVSQENSNSSEMEKTLFPIHHGNDQNFQPNGLNFLHDNVTKNTFDHHESMNVCTMDSNNDRSNLPVPVFSDDMMQEIPHLKGENGTDFCKEMQLKMKRKYEAPAESIQTPEGSFSPELSPNKKCRPPRNTQKNQRGKNKKVIQDNVDDEEEKNNGVVKNRQSSSSYSSEDDSNGGSTSLNSNGKSRASRGSATDPQSLYARRRRERINERLRILQNLVPNGTKVDISTMLEEAVHYVKFMQLQIKLLSSDDLWMYAPLAYNGMDIGMYQKISPNLLPQI